MNRFIESFDGYATGQIPARFAIYNPAAHTIVSGGRNEQCLNSSNASDIGMTFPDDQATWIAGASFKFPSFTAGNTVISLRHSGVWKLKLEMVGDGRMQVRAGNSGTIFQVIPFVLQANIWNFIELKATIAAAGSYAVRINGIQMAAGSGDTRGESTTALANQVVHRVTMQMDDLYINDALGAQNRDFWGDNVITRLRPTRDGRYRQYTPSTPGAHYVLVDDDTPNTADYVQTDTVGQKETFGYGPVPTITGPIRAVQHSVFMRKNNLGTRAIAPVLVHGGGEVIGDPVGPGTAESYWLIKNYDVNPITGQAWRPAELEEAEFGEYTAL